MDAQTFQTTIQAWLQRPEVVLIEDLIKNQNPDIEQAMLQLQQQRIDDGANELFINCTAMEGSNLLQTVQTNYKTFKQFVEENSKPSLMYAANDLTEDVGICHILTGAGYEFLKINLCGLQDVLKVNELIRIAAQLKSEQKQSRGKKQ